MIDFPTFINVPWLDWIGWAGAAGLLVFYWLLGSQRVLAAYIFGTFGALCWLLVGVATKFGFAAELPSLVFMEVMVVVMNIRGIRNWLKAKRTAEDDSK